MRDIFNSWRCFSLNEESGVLICTWPKGGKPAIPLPYNTEAMHGFEWTFAAHLAMLGMTDQATEIAASIRSRYDGEKRNPWNEIECGSNYARSMAAYGLLCTCSGFTFDLREGALGFAPKIPMENFVTFWSVGTAWGTVSIAENQAELRVISGEIFLRKLTLPFGEFHPDRHLCAGDLCKMQKQD